MSAKTIEKLKLVASDGAIEDYFGTSVAISGAYMIIGARGDDDRGENSGSAYIFKNDGNGNFTQIDKLTASDGSYRDSFGWGVAISGDCAVIGAPGDDDNGNNSGSAYIFRNDGNGNFIQTDKLTASDGSTGDSFGRDVAISGDYVIIATSGNSGAAYIFKNDGNGNFTQITKLTTPDLHKVFGYRVAISGEYMAVTTESSIGNIPGSVYIFKNDGTDHFIEIDRLDGSTSGYEAYGCDVAMNGQYIIVGAKGDDYAYGSAYLYKNDGSDNFSQISRLTPSDGRPRARFGCSTDIQGDHIVIGAVLYGLFDSSSMLLQDKGAAFIFKNDGHDNFLEIAKLVASDGVHGDELGGSVAISDDYAIAGASRNDEGGKNVGAVYLYDLNESILQIYTYRIQYFNGRHPLTAKVQLYNKESEEIGNISFYKDAGTVPSNDTQSPSGYVDCHYLSEQYAEVIDLVRNEKPVFLHFNSADNLGFLTTKREPVGEEEKERKMLKRYPFPLLP